MKLLILSLSLLSLAVLADDAAKTKDHPCAADVKKFCAGIEKGGGRIEKCLKEHEKDLSSACTEKRAEIMKAHPCMADIEKFCAGIQPGEGRIDKCIKEHEKELSPACVAKNAERKEKMKNMHEACKDDMEKLCKEMKAGHGDKMRCLMSKKDQASDKCKATLP